MSSVAWAAAGLGAFYVFAFSFAIDNLMGRVKALERERDAA